MSVKDRVRAALDADTSDTGEIIAYAILEADARDLGDISERLSRSAEIRAGEVEFPARTTRWNGGFWFEEPIEANIFIHLVLGLAAHNKETLIKDIEDFCEIKEILFQYPSSSVRVRCGV